MPIRPLLLLGLLCGCGRSGDKGAAAAPFRVITWNTGTSEGMPHDAKPDDGYTSEQALQSDSWYGDGLAWLPAVDAATDFFATVDADIVVFQEIFGGDCSQIPSEAHPDFVCETWKKGDPTVAQTILGAGWQVMCHPGHDDKCAAVHEDFGQFVGCDSDFCLGGMQGATIDGCGSGARVGRGLIERVDGPELTLVNVHGSSGLSKEDQACRTAQVGQVFEDLDGAPAVNGERNLVMGDLNTDPARWVDADISAARWGDFVGEGRDFHFISDAGIDGPGSYNGLADIDHVMSDVLNGSCWIAGLTEGHPQVIDAVYFDHKPVVCEVSP